MLENTFVHVSGIGTDAERSLWRQGCGCWADLVGGIDRFSCGSADRGKVLKTINRSIRCLEKGEHQFFRKALGLKEAWRAFPEFRSSCVYLDIETDGSQNSQSITMIGLYDGSNYTCLMKDVDLGNFPDVISHYSMIVTFFGIGFDLPMIQKSFPCHRFDQIHIDLCPALRRVGLAGGLKRIEKEVGIQRSKETEGLTGQDAVRLWRQHTRFGNDSALEKLIAYNREDVVNLERLAEHAYGCLREETMSLSTSEPTPTGQLHG